MPQEDKSVTELAEEEATVVESAKEVSPKGDEEVVAPEGEEAKTATHVEEENVSVTGTGEVKVDEAKEIVPAVEEGTVEENPLNKMFEDLHSRIDNAFQNSAVKTEEALTKVTSEFEQKLSGLAEKHTDLAKELGALTAKLDSMEKKIDTVEQSGAFKKSADLGGSEEDSSIQKSSNSVWRGSFFSADLLS